MLLMKTTPVHSEYRHSNPRNQYIWNRPHILQEHFTSASYQQKNTPFKNYPNRPHLNVQLDNNYKVKALVDTGSSICIGDSSLIRHLKKQFPIAPLINVTDVHNARKPILGCYGAMLSVEDPMPYPLLDKPINIHMTTNLSSELILGTYFLSDHGAIIDIKSNNAIFLPANTLPLV